MPSTRTTASRTSKPGKRRSKISRDLLNSAPLHSRNGGSKPPGTKRREVAIARVDQARTAADAGPALVAPRLLREPTRCTRAWPWTT